MRGIKEIEDVIYAHYKVQEVAVIGVPEPYRGEMAKAFVVVKENQTLTQQEIIEYYRRNLTGFKVPKLIVFRESLPTSLVGKVLKRELKEEEKAKQQENT